MSGYKSKDLLPFLRDLEDNFEVFKVEVENLEA